jgi:hypothetical protein
LKGDLDISRLLDKGVVSLAAVEHDLDRQARIRKEELEHRHDLWKSWIIFCLVVGSYCLLFAFCIFVILKNDLSADTTQGKLAWLGVTSLFAGLVGKFTTLATTRK